MATYELDTTGDPNWLRRAEELLPQLRAGDEVTLTDETARKVFRGLLVKKFTGDVMALITLHTFGERGSASERQSHADAVRDICRVQGFNARDAALAYGLAASGVGVSALDYLKPLADMPDGLSPARLEALGAYLRELTARP